MASFGSTADARVMVVSRKRRSRSLNQQGEKARQLAYWARHLCCQFAGLIKVVLEVRHVRPIRFWLGRRWLSLRLGDGAQRERHSTERPLVLTWIPNVVHN